MRQIWLGLAAITAAASGYAMGCGDAVQPATGPTSSSSGAGGDTSTATSTATATATATSTATSSATGTGGMPATSSASGTGGMPECVMGTDCPGMDKACTVRTCTMGKCGTMNIANGMDATAQTPGDCKKNVCDGQGNSMPVNDDGDIPVDSMQCTIDKCSSGLPSNPPEMAGKLCSEGMGNKVCDGAGTCVPCAADADCNGGICKMNQCVAISCGDMMQNGSESDVDCGGTCSKCGMGLKCNSGADCADGVCSGMPQATCQAPTCGDMVQNGTETDVDCGSTCPSKCADNLKCKLGTDCTSKVCSGVPLVCQMPTCTDAAQNGSETDVDCGGTCVKKCGLGKGCTMNADCTGGLCNAGVHTCEPTCTDGSKDLNETDVDCGGSCAMKCGLNMGCAGNSDCASGICTGGLCSQINGCDVTNTIDKTGQASITVTFSFPSYTPPCIKVSLGTKVTFDGGFVGAFGSHPLVGGQVIAGMKVQAVTGPFLPLFNDISVQTKLYTMSSAGTFPYYCDFHALSGMMGVVIVQ
jgi:hypothetical protein